VPERPLALFVTLSAYGNRLHGDERGTVDRQHNAYGEQTLGRNDGRLGFESNGVSAAPMTFTIPLRSAIETAIQHACLFRDWELLACHCRTNHLHAVIGTDADRDEVIARLKDRCTRSLRAAKLIVANQPLWARGGSGRRLWTEADVEAACEYTMNAQGDPIPGTMHWKERQQSEARPEGLDR
jgi:REP element-mobilizing transposase RayT